MRNILSLLLLTLSVAGCGPLFVPMPPRLDPDEQKQADESWHNMLTPPDRVDREALLGALTFFEMYQSGIDRLDFHSEKHVDEKRVVMDIHFQRENPDDDAFYVTVFGSNGRVLRTERYSRDEVEKLRFNLAMDAVHTTSQPSTPEQEATEAEAKRRMLAIMAATQPAGWKPPPEPATKP